MRERERETEKREREKRERLWGGMEVKIEQC